MIRSTNTKTERYMGVIQDISDRQKTSSALQENQNLLKDAEKLAHLGSWQYDILTGKIS